MPGKLGLFRDVIGPVVGPVAKWFGRGARWEAKRGFGALKSNAGFGWSALKGDPRTVMGLGGLETMGRFARGAGASARGMNPRGVWENMRGFGKAAGGWFSAADLAGQGKLRGIAGIARGASIPGAFMAADFLNPWGLGWGD